MGGGVGTGDCGGVASGDGVVVTTGVFASGGEVRVPIGIDANPGVGIAFRGRNLSWS